MGAGRRLGKVTEVGPNIALLAGTYGWLPDEIAKFTPRQVKYFLEHLPDVEMRRAWPAAQLEATIRNMMGGKRPAKDKPKDPPLQAHELYTPLELLPYFAKPAWAEEASVSIAPDAARAFLRHRHDLPAWVIAVAPLDAIQRAAQAQAQ